MENQIFNNAFFQLNAKEKARILQAKMLGLRLAIIYLDDEPEALEFFSMRCNELGIEPITSVTSTELLKFISWNKARILFVVSDYNMPIENGFQFRQKVMELSPDIPFYILSAHVDREQALEGMKLKIVGFLDKPMHKEAFVNLLKSEGEARAVSIRDDYEMLKSFTNDVVDIIAEIEEGCLQLEKATGDKEIISRVFGLVHTIKGSSGFFEPRTLHLFGHAFEEVLKGVQNGTKIVSTALISSWLKACDIIKLLNNEFATGEHKEHDIEELKKILVIKESSDSPVSKGSEILQPKDEGRDQKISDIKVSMTVLEEFTQVSGELTVIRNMINKVVGSIEKQHSSDKDVQVLSELLGEMHKINSDMQSKISDIRRVPVTQLIKPLSRNMRDTSKALGKEVDFVIEGEDLRLDNAIADTLSRSLVHLMRNSLDHGLETNQERVASGKPYKGRLLLRFESVNEVIIVTLEDDGRGINTDKIRQKVISQGLRSEKEAAAMSEKELHLMIFEAGFSTAAQVTEFSGRGVGMSMVKETIESQHGKLKIFSEKSKGSSFRIEIPIPKSVLITNCLFVSVGKMMFGLPQDFVLRVLDKRSFGTGVLESLDKARFVRFEGQLVPLISLAGILGLRGEDENLLVILDTHGILFALEVSNVHDTEDAVIKPLATNDLKSLKVYQGGTFLGDGTVGLILDVPGLALKLDLKKASASKIVEPAKTTEKLINVISFSLKSSGTFAIPEADVIRVESVKMINTSKSGNAIIIPYRDSIMTLMNLDNLLFGEDVLGWEDHNELHTLILRHENQYIGITVNRIQDLEAVRLDISPTLKKRMGIKGNVLHKDKSLVILDTREILELAVGQEEKESDMIIKKAA
jgi:two-component system chemotaxis sensor kinase CheA